MKKILVILVTLSLVVLFLPDSVKAQDGRAEHVKAEIQKHKRAIHQLKAELHTSGEASAEGGYSDEGYEGEDYSGGGYERGYSGMDEMEAKTQQMGAPSEGAEGGPGINPPGPKGGPGRGKGQRINPPGPKGGPGKGRGKQHPGMGKGPGGHGKGKGINPPGPKGGRGKGPGGGKKGGGRKGGGRKR